jgi:hypothetical protein
LGTAALVALPLVTSVILPQPAEAASCVPCFQSCAGGGPCCNTAMDPCPVCRDFGGGVKLCTP